MNGLRLVVSLSAILGTVVLVTPASPAQGPMPPCDPDGDLVQVCVPACIGIWRRVIIRAENKPFIIPDGSDTGPVMPDGSSNMGFFHYLGYEEEYFDDDTGEMAWGPVYRVTGWVQNPGDCQEQVTACVQAFLDGWATGRDQVAPWEDFQTTESPCDLPRVWGL